MSSVKTNAYSSIQINHQWSVVADREAPWHNTDTKIPFGRFTQKSHFDKYDEKRGAVVDQN